MIKEHLVSASITNGAECICNPEVLFGTNYGLWNFETETAPRGTLLDLNAAWELFLSRKGFSNVSFDVIEHHQHEVIDGVVYEDGDTTYILKDDKGNPTGATFTVKANKGPVEHIEWQDGNLILYYTKTKPLTQEDIDSGVPIHYVYDENDQPIIDQETGQPLIYEYVKIPIIEIFDNHETHKLFPWFADDQHTVRLRQNLDDDDDDHLGDFAVTSDSEVFVAKEKHPENTGNTLVSLQSVYDQLKKDLGINPVYTETDDYTDIEGDSIHERVTGSDIETKLITTTKASLADAINEDKTRVDKTHKLINATDSQTTDEVLAFCDYIVQHKNTWTNNTRNLLEALNWIQETQIGEFLDDNIIPNVDTVTEALNSIFTEAEENRDRIGYDRVNKQWIALTTDKNQNLTEAINEVDQHTDALADIVQVTENWDPVNKVTYYSNPDLNNITKNRLRLASINKDDVTIVESINELQSQIGNLSSSRSGDQSVQLSTDNKNTLVEAINEVDLHADNNAAVLGATYTTNAAGVKNSDISNLETTDKSSIVAAINELDSRIGELDGLDTEAQTNVVDSINEVIKEQPFVYVDVNNPDSGVVLKDQSQDQSKTNYARDHSLALGTNNEITSYSLANGSENTSQGDYTFISGEDNTSQKRYNLVSGLSNTNDGNYNLVNGNGNSVVGSNNTVSGTNNDVTVTNSTVLGDNVIAPGSDNITAIGNSIEFIQSVDDSIAIGKSLSVNGSDSIALGNSNTVSEESVTIGHGNETSGPGNFAVGDNNYIGCDNSYTFGNGNTTDGGDHTYVIGEGNNISGDYNYVIGKNQTISNDGNYNNNILIGTTGTIRNNNSTIIGPFNEPKDNATNIGKDIYIQTHDTESKLQELIFVNLNDWCKKNNAASLNGEKFLDTAHLVQALKVYLAREGYTDKALLRFTMQDGNENGYILVQGKSKRIYLNGSWYFSDNIENGWSRHEGEYLKVITKTIVDQQGNQQTKHYLAFMDQLSTDAVVDTVGGQRSNTEDFSTIDLTHAYGAVDMDDLENAMDLQNRFNQKVDKYARIITKYSDANGAIYEKTQNFIHPNDPSLSNNITLSLEDSFGFNKNNYQLLSEKGQPNGYTPLDSNGKVSSDYLPSYVDDVIDVWATYTETGNWDLVDVHLYEIINSIDEQGHEVISRGPEILTGEKGKIYVEAQPKAPNSSHYQFRWTGTQFVVIGAHLVIGESAGTAFDGARGKADEDGLQDHLNSGTTTIPVLDPNTGEQQVDEQGNPMWVVYKPNPHHVTAQQLPVVVNDPNSPDNTQMEDDFYVNHTVDSAIKNLYDRINADEDSSNNIAAVIGTAEDLQRLDDLNNIEGDNIPTIAGLALDNRERLDSFIPLDNNTIDNLVATHFLSQNNGTD